MANPAQYQHYQVMCTTWLPVVNCTVTPVKLLDTSTSQKDKVWFLPVPFHCNCSILVKWLSRLAEGYVICGFLWLGWLLNICLIMFFFFLVTFFSLKVKLQCLQLKGCFRIIILSAWGHLQTGECCNSFIEFLRTVTLLMKSDWFWKICLTTISFLLYSAFCIQIS